MELEVLEALDTARTQYYHVKAIIIAGMGFFTDAYDLFCISVVANSWVAFITMTLLQESLESSR